MLEEERKIIFQLRHQWHVRGNISDDELQIALRDLQNGNNPFLRNELISKLKKDPNLSLDGVDTYKMENDV